MSREKSQGIHVKIFIEHWSQEEKNWLPFQSKIKGKKTKSAFLIIFRYPHLAIPQYTIFHWILTK